MPPTSADRGLGGGTNHVCLVHDSPGERMRVLEGHVAAALSEGRRVIVLAESTDDQRLADLFGRTGHGVRPDQVEIRAAPDAYMAHGSFDSDAMLCALAADKRQALADGFTGLHLVADMSWAADHARAPDRLPAYEHAAGEICADGTATAICQYDRTRFRAGALAACTAAHALLESAFDETETLADDRVAVHVGRHGSVRACGEVDLRNAELLERALAIAAERSRDVCLDASELTFIDIRGVSALFEAARNGGIALLAPHSPLRGMLDALDARRQLPGLQTG